MREQANVSGLSCSRTRERADDGAVAFVHALTGVATRARRAVSVVAGVSPRLQECTP